MRASRAALPTYVALVLVVTATFLVGGCRRTGRSVPATGGADRSESIMSGGRDRTFTIHVPPSYNGSASFPLVLAYHGHGGDGAGMARLTGMDAVADTGGFLVVYPDGIDRGWNDGRVSTRESMTSGSPAKW